VREGIVAPLYAPRRRPALKTARTAVPRPPPHQYHPAPLAATAGSTFVDHDGGVRTIRWSDPEVPDEGWVRPSEWDRDWKAN